MESWFDSVGLVSSINSGALVTDNVLGIHMLGGTGVIKGNVIDMNPIHVQFPHFSAGCGGISYGMGAINLVTGDELVNTAKAILKNAGAYAFELGLHIITPIIDAKMGGILSKAISFNGININSCEIGRTLVNYGTSFMENENISKFVCEHGGNHALVNDHIEARHKCNSSPKHRETTQNEIAKKSDLLSSEYNLTWVILNKMKKDFSPEEKNLFLNLTGTIIRTKGGTQTIKDKEGGKIRDEIQYESKIFPPKGDEVWNCLIKGGTIKNAYSFFVSSEKNNADFAEVNTGKDLTISPKNSWSWTILKTMREIRKKILSGRSGIADGEGKYALSEKETTLLNQSKLPLATLLTISSTKKGRASLTSLSEYADLVAFLKVYDFFEEVLDKIKETAFSLESAQISSSDLVKYIRSLEDVRKNLQVEKSFVFKQIEHTKNFVKFLREDDNYRRTMESL